MHKSCIGRLDIVGWRQAKEDPMFSLASARMNAQRVVAERAFYRWLMQQGISFRMRFETDEDPSIHNPAQVYKFDAYVIFNNRNDHLKFELVWKGRYGEP